MPSFIPLIIHNTSNYDTHLFIKNSKANYISFSQDVDVDKTVDKAGETSKKHELRFLDSFKLMASSVDSLSKNLGKDQHTHLQKHYRGRQLELLLRKGVHPYDYVNCMDKLSERSLHPKDKFYSRLNDEDVTDEDYKNTLKQSVKNLT